MNEYTAITFAPVQGFIEKSRKLRDLYGASLILSYLSQQLVLEVEKRPGLKVISPASHNLQQGMPNRILIKGEVSKEKAEEILLTAWKNILQVCRTWVEKKLPNYQYHWEREWTLWGCHTWEIFQGRGDSIQAAMDDLETRKLSRAWTAVNWIGESSSLTGTDAIAFPGLGAETRNPKNMNYRSEDDSIKGFYTQLARKLDNCPPDKEPEGKYIAPNEKLSIPELVKRLITLPEIADLISQAIPNNQPLEKLKRFQEIERKPQPNKNVPGQWTGWFMGDGDKVGDYLKKLADGNDSDIKIETFSQAMRNWGKQFEQNFPEDLGRVVYAGGDDFLGIIYSKNPAEPIQPLTAYQWLMAINDKWQEHKQSITVSVGFVWVAGSVPQRDVLQHCREAEKVAKSLGRNRVTIRVVFNSGQYVQWTCPWDYLHILTKYRDREKQSNWSHVYQDLAHLESRRTFKIENAKEAYIVKKSAIEFFELYFPGEGQKLLEDKNYKLAQYLVGFNENDDEIDRAKATIDWMTDLIKVGWHLCSNT
ncbi:Cas10/Cmr2 second palm domain-containing protein [Cylindrospermum sp. FACHB-282]|uniref:Cas10/Cmr2 second palm domain-containing protein n=1 Tax=Cylindrospermum sp. FACHB-282 TaxID=2692794 RepID=UPI001688552D|nr:type III-B CRISPR-associated protein Cas10/Cmr2 [Cylindrospermum sp. FACHB-282]MBD2388509.1 CRISPR-associated protein Cmr2 [Cylindrospermum sp. FACHB-282]